VKNPKSKIQNPNKFEAPSSNGEQVLVESYWNFEFGISLDFGFWDLEFLFA
jgi:hypothetical protein